MMLSSITYSSWALIQLTLTAITILFLSLLTITFLHKASCALLANWTGASSSKTPAGRGGLIELV